ncbi:hypothetical protein Tco_0916325, partial [Tanacetum coccineum]
KPNPKIDVTREKKDQLNLARAEAKCVSAEVAGAALEAAKKPATIEKEVVDLSGNTRTSTPPFIRSLLIRVVRTSQEKELTDGLKDLERGRDEWRATASNQVEQIHSLEKDIKHKTRQLEITEEKIRILKDEKLALSAKLA